MPKKKKLSELVSVEELPPVVSAEGENLPAQVPQETMDLGTVDNTMVHRNMRAACNSCFISDTCPQYEPGAECSLDFKMLFDNQRKLEALPQAFLDVVEMQFLRIQKAYVFEMNNQGVLDPNLTKEIELFSEMMSKAKKLAEKNDTFTLTASGEAVKEGGILSKLLGGGK